MKNFLKTIRFILVLVILVSCGKANQQNEAKDEVVSDDPNQALYDQVMAIHNEVMPKSGEIYKLKKKLQDTIAVSPGLKSQFEQTIAELDSADRSMMDWMHKFSEPDSVSQEKAREYLENEMEKIKKVRELTNSSLQKAKDQLGKKN